MSPLDGPCILTFCSGFVSRDPEHYQGRDSTRDALLLAVLLDAYAGRDAEAAWKKYNASSQM